MSMVFHSVPALSLPSRPDQLSILAAGSATAGSGRTIRKCWKRLLNTSESEIPTCVATPYFPLLDYLLY